MRSEVRRIMWQFVSLRRDQSGLLEAKQHIQALRQSLLALSKEASEQTMHTARGKETENMLLVAELVIAAALKRCESRGSHWRSDYEQLDETLTGCHYAFMREMPAMTEANPRQEIIAYA